MSDRIKMMKYITEVKNNSLQTLPIDSSMTEELAELMLEAYKATPDYEGETFVETVEELDNVFKGYYGTFMEKESHAVVNEEGELLSAIFLCLYKNEPTITYLFTNPSETGKGYAKGLINKSTDSLHDNGYDKIFLYVSTANKPAISLYKTMGFVQIPINASAIDRELMEEIHEREIAQLESEKLLNS